MFVVREKRQSKEMRRIIITENQGLSLILKVIAISKVLYSAQINRYRFISLEQVTASEPDPQG